MDAVPTSIRVRSGKLSQDQQALVAVTLTLMSAHLFGGSEVNSEDVAAEVASNLEMLRATEGLDEEFRQLCARLHALWQKAAEGGGA
jgi:hypothetical protein